MLRQIVGGFSEHAFSVLTRSIWIPTFPFRHFTMQLTAKQVSEWCGEAASDVTELNLSGKDITNVDSMEECTSLRKLNLSKNALQSIGGIGSLPSLTWLSLAQNQLKSMQGLESFDKLNGKLLYVLLCIWIYSCHPSF